MVFGYGVYFIVKGGMVAKRVQRVIFRLPKELLALTASEPRKGDIVLEYIVGL